jgi:hypothetical protein
MVRPLPQRNGASEGRRLSYNRVVEANTSPQPARLLPKNGASRLGSRLAEGVGEGAVSIGKPKRCFRTFPHPSSRLHPPPKPGFARREARKDQPVAAEKKGARGGNMVSPTLKAVSLLFVRVRVVVVAVALPEAWLVVR